VHTHINQFYRYGEIVGDPRYGATSIQYDEQFAGQFVEQWRSNSASAGHRWVVDMDENTNGLGPSNVSERRRQILYDVLFSGGNIEWYFGYEPQPVGGDVDAGDFRQRDAMWQQMRLAREMMQNELPFWHMEPADWRVSGDRDAFGGAEVFALAGEVYAVYLPSASGQEFLNTGRAEGRFGQRWFDPRTGQMFNGSDNLAASDSLPLGAPPHSPGEDWVVLVTRLDQSTALNPGSGNQGGHAGNSAPRFNELPSRSVSVGERVTMTLTATDPDGTFPSVTVGALPAGMRVNGPGNGQLELSWTVPEDAAAESVVELIAVDALDGSLRTSQQLIIQVQDAGTGTTLSGSAQAGVTNPGSGPAPAGISAPVFRAISAQSIRGGELLQLRVQADDADGIPPALIVIDPPSGSRFDDNGDGSRTFRWQTSAAHAGRHTITVVARDHDLPSLSATMNIELQITP
jgi:hypothetical protein